MSAVEIYGVGCVGIENAGNIKNKKVKMGLLLCVHCEYPVSQLLRETPSRSDQFGNTQIEISPTTNSKTNQNKNNKMATKLEPEYAQINHQHRL